MARRKVTDEEIGRLFDLVASYDVTKAHMAAHLGIGLRRTDDVIHAVRHVLHDDTINLVCNPPEGGRGPWVYSLVGTMTDAKPWTTRGVRDVRSRLETIEVVVGSMVNGTDGRTVEGKIARMLQRTITRAMEDIADFTS